MKLIWKEHKCTCERVELAARAVDALTQNLRELSVETEGRSMEPFSDGSRSLLV